MTSKIAIRDGNGGGTHDGINQSIRTMGEITVINPDIPRAKYGNSIAVGFASVPDVCRTRPYVSITGRDTIVNTDVVYNHVTHVLQSYTTAAGYLDECASAVDGFVTVHYKLVFQLDLHIGCENDPERFFLDHCVPECSWSWVNGIVIRRVGDYVDLTTFPSHGVLTESNAAVC